MAKYSVEIEETLQKVIDVEAESLEEALEKIDEQYNNGDIELDYENFVGHEIREYKKEVTIEDLVQNTTVWTDRGNLFVLEKYDNAALLKTINGKETQYIVASGINVNKYKTGFDWLHGFYFESGTEAYKKFEELTGHEKTQNAVIYSELGEFTLGSHNITRFDSVEEAFDFFVDEDLKKEDLVEMIPEKAKRDIVYSFADVILEEDGKFYYGQDLYFFEEEINEKTYKIDKILTELNIKNIKPYDVIELLEQSEIDYINEDLKEQINKAIKTAGYEKNIEDFIDYINEELYAEESHQNEEENEM